MDNLKPPSIEYEPTNVKTERFELATKELRGQEKVQTNFVEQYVQLSLIYDASNEANVQVQNKLNKESSDEDDRPLADWLGDDDFDSDSSSDRPIKLEENSSVVKKRRGRPLGWRKQQDSSSGATFTPVIKKSCAKRGPGRPPGAKNKVYDARTHSMNDKIESPAKRPSRPTTGIFFL